jgi:L-lysine exporter family protein LysE/ArgO
MSLSVYLTGLMSGLSLIVAIGAQNAFVLRQGLLGKHVFAVYLACSLSDAALGVTSFRQIAVAAPLFVPAMRYGGAAFLIWYGARNLYSALRSFKALAPADARSSSLAQTLATCLALTWSIRTSISTRSCCLARSRPDFRVRRRRSLLER